MAPVDPAALAPDADRYRRADHAWLAELDAVSVHAGEPHQRMDTRAVADDEWFVADEHRDVEPALRRRLRRAVPHPRGLAPAVAVEARPRRGGPAARRHAALVA